MRHKTVSFAVSNALPVNQNRYAGEVVSWPGLPAVLYSHHLCLKNTDLRRVGWRPLLSSAWWPRCQERLSRAPILCELVSTPAALQSESLAGWRSLSSSRPSDDRQTASCSAGRCAPAGPCTRTRESQIPKISTVRQMFHKYLHHLNFFLLFTNDG